MNRPKTLQANAEGGAHRRRLLSAAARATLLAALAVFGCDQRPPADTAAGAEPVIGALDGIRERGVLRIGVSDSQADLFSFVDREGRWAGLDIDLATAVAGEMSSSGLVPGLAARPEVLSESWHYDRGHPDYGRIKLLDALLLSGEVDFVVSGMSITPEREAQYGIRFSDPYYVSYQCLVTRPEAEIRSVEDVLGRAIGSQQGTTNSQLAEYLGSTIEPSSGYNTLDELFRDLEQHAVDALLLDCPVAEWKDARLGHLFAITPVEREALEALHASGRLGRPYPGPLSEDYGAAVRAGDTELLEVLNTVIRGLVESGAIEEWKRGYLDNGVQAEAESAATGAP